MTRSRTERNQWKESIPDPVKQAVQRSRSARRQFTLRTRRAWRELRGATNIPHSNGETVPTLECLISYNRFGGYCVPVSTRRRPASLAVLAGNVYESLTIDFMIDNCGNGDVVHAGTFFGDFIPAISRACGPDSKVWAFEPNRESFRCAEITVLLNGLQNCILTNAGLGEIAAKRFLRTKNERGEALGGGSSFASDSDIDQSLGEQSRVVAVDQVVPRDRNVSILQLDVEGHEIPALKGSLETIKRCSPILILEVLGDSDPTKDAWFTEHLTSFGYRRRQEIQENWIFTVD